MESSLDNFQFHFDVIDQFDFLIYCQPRFFFLQALLQFVFIFSVFCFLSPVLYFHSSYVVLQSILPSFVLFSSRVLFCTSLQSTTAFTGLFLFLSFLPIQQPSFYFVSFGYQIYYISDNFPLGKFQLFFFHNCQTCSYRLTR